MRNVLAGVLMAAGGAMAADVLVEAEEFAQRGGWVVDQQAASVMGSPYLMAHGLGVTVADAATEVRVPASGDYRVWVRTRNWVARWNPQEAPGRFKVLVNGRALDTVFGVEGDAWHWQNGGAVKLAEGQAKLALRDLTGFNGRCDALLLTTDPALVPPDGGEGLAAFRRRLRGLPAEPEDAGSFDLVVVGGGMAGCCAAVSAARQGCTVALLQDRPVLGGNNSSEVRVGLSGQIRQPPYPRLGELVDELGPVGHWNLVDAKRNPDLPRSKEVLEIIARNPEKTQHNAGPATNYGDDQKRRVVEAEKSLKLFLGTQAAAVRKEGKVITGVVGRDIITGKERLFRGALFADCTGDGAVGYLAGADYRTGREARGETAEDLAPEAPDKLVMGTSVQWYAEDTEEASLFPACQWALPFSEETAKPLMRGDWDWEAGMNLDQVADVEQIRDHALRATFGHWAFLKNQSRHKAKFSRRRLAWVAYIGGKRESRRLLGDVVLCQQDIEGQRAFPDACVTTTWPIDLHYPNPENSRQFPGQEFRSIAKGKKIKPYALPYRCLYSRNVDNLFMAGRDISVTHVALGTVRVMRTTGMMGEVVGMAAALCTRHKTLPRGVYESHLDELKAAMSKGCSR